MLDPITRDRKASALRTLLEIMEVPADRQVVTPANLRWLARNLQINHSGHPLFETAREILLQLLRDKVEEQGRLFGAVARAEAFSLGYEKWMHVVSWTPNPDGLVDIRRDDGPNGTLVVDSFDPFNRRYA